MGICAMELYLPVWRVSQAELELLDSEEFGPGVIGKYTKGMGLHESRFVSDDEDPVSMALSALHRLMASLEKTAGLGASSPWEQVGRLEVGTESIIDRSKSMKSYLMEPFERRGLVDVEGVDAYHACYGGSSVLLGAANWVRARHHVLDSSRPYAVVVATDVADGANGRCNGAGAIAILVGSNAPVVLLPERASCVLHRFDFCKPVGWRSMWPIMDGANSLMCYMECVDACHA